MTEVHRCDRTDAHDDIGDALFAGQPAVTIQTPRGAYELCPSCVEEFDSWWNPDEREDTDSDTIADHMEE